MSHLILQACLLLALAVASPAARAEVLADGTTVLALPAPGAPRVAMRYVVRAGAADDPASKEGLAHLLEHCIFHGSRKTSEQSLQDAMREAGATMNAYTSARSMVFILDAPRSSFASLAETFLQVVTNPQFEDAKVMRELGVIQTEEVLDLTGGHVRELIEGAVYPAISKVDVIGTTASRLRIEVRDLVAFYGAHFRPANTALVVSGDITTKEIEALASRAILLPPSLASERRPPPPAARPSLPLQTSARAPATFAVIGHLVSPEDAAVCDEMASAAQLRLSLAVQIREEMAQAVHAECAVLSGNTFLLALLLGNDLLATRLPEAAQEALHDLARRPLSAKERDIVAQRRDRLHSALLRDPAALVEAVVLRATGSSPVAAPEEILRTTKAVPAQVLSKALQRTLHPDRRLRIGFSPL